MSISKEIKCYEDIFKQPIEHLVSFVAKEAGEMIKSVYIDEDEHWKNELGDLCGLVIPPLLKKAGLTFEEAQEIGRKRFEEKIKLRKK